MKAENVCRFIGQLVSFSITEVGQEKYKLGKGVLFLPDPTNNSIGQKINFMAWEEKAVELDSVQRGSWIQLLTSYTPSTFRGILQDTFTVLAFTHTKND